MHFAIEIAKCIYYSLFRLVVYNYNGHKQRYVTVKSDEKIKNNTKL